MSTLTVERSVEQTIAAWREGLDDPTNPAGPLFSGGYAEQEITMTGPADPGPHTWEIITCMYEC